jgi:isopenicillin-N N-acyltransferase-like protein
MSEESVPELCVEGTTKTAGRKLGEAWAEVFRNEAATKSEGSRPWWKELQYSKLIKRYAPHLPALYQAIAKGAGLHEDLVGTRPIEDAGGCTSFAVAPHTTLDGLPISGQTKDVSRGRAEQFVVLRMKLKDAPSALTLTYDGWLFGHGFVQERCSIYRNSLYTGATGGTMPYAVWGILALHCRSIEEVMKLTKDHLVNLSFHCTVADQQGGIIGIENGPGGPVFLKPRRGIYTHANEVVSSRRLMKHENPGGDFQREDSVKRTQHLRENLDTNRGRLTSQLALAAFADHRNYPVSLCRHQSLRAMTGGLVIGEPAKGLLHVVRGPVCQNWSKTYEL